MDISWEEFKVVASTSTQLENSDAYRIVIELLGKVEWLSLIQAVAVVFTAYIASSALHTWRHQVKAQKQTDCLDQLTDSVHEYRQLLVQPIHHLKYIRIAFESYQNLPRFQTTHPYSNIVAYIEEDGGKDSKILWEYLNSLNPLIAKIQTLVTRGQVYGFINFSDCHESIRMLLWQHDRLAVVAAMIGRLNSVWDHPLVIKNIESMLTVEPDDIERHLKEYNLEFMDFVQENYESIFKGS